MVDDQVTAAESRDRPGPGTGGRRRFLSLRRRHDRRSRDHLRLVLDVRSRRVSARAGRHMPNRPCSTSGIRIRPQWGGQSFPWSGWAIDDPANNYYYSFLQATMFWTLADDDASWMEFPQYREDPVADLVLRRHRRRQSGRHRLRPLAQAALLSLSRLARLDRRRSRQCQRSSDRQHRVVGECDGADARPHRRDRRSGARLRARDLRLSPRADARSAPDDARCERAERRLMVAELDFRAGNGERLQFPRRSAACGQRRLAAARIWSTTRQRPAIFSRAPAGIPAHCGSSSMPARMSRAMRIRIRARSRCTRTRGLR